MKYLLKNADMYSILSFVILSSKNIYNYSKNHGETMSKKLTQRDIAGILKVDTKTIYNWRKNKPELYRIIMLGFKFEELLEASEESLRKLKEIAKDNSEYRLNSKQNSQKMKM